MDQELTESVSTQPLHKQASHISYIILRSEEHFSDRTALLTFQLEKLDVTGGVPNLKTTIRISDDKNLSTFEVLHFEESH